MCMVVVTGSMRSGTSAWMQILRAAGLPVIGEAFPEPFGQTFRAANPRGFYESELVAGVYFATNPHPVTGDWLAPAATRRHAVKVFPQGVVRTDFAFLDRVLVTLRPWRDVAASRSVMATLGPIGPSADVDPALLWWVDAYGVLRDVAIRGYAAHFVAYDRLIQDPEREIAAALAWIGEGDGAAAVRVVDPALRRSTAAEAPISDLPRPILDVFDELVAHVAAEAPLSEAFVRKLNETDAAVQPQLERAREAQRRHLLHRFTSGNPA